MERKVEDTYLNPVWQKLGKPQRRGLRPTRRRSPQHHRISECKEEEISGKERRDVATEGYRRFEGENIPPGANPGERLSRSCRRLRALSSSEEEVGLDDSELECPPFSFPPGRGRLRPICWLALSSSCVRNASSSSSSSIANGVKSLVDVVVVVVVVYMSDPPFV